MGRRKRKSDKKKEGESSIDTKKLNKLDAMQEIDDLKAEQETSVIEGNPDTAIILANKIIELAIRFDMSYYIKEQEDFLKAIAHKEQKKYFTAELGKEFQNLKNMFEKLVEANQIAQAHNIVEDFKQKHFDNPILESIPAIKVFFENERRFWIKYQSSSDVK